MRFKNFLVFTKQPKSTTTSSKPRIYVSPDNDRISTLISNWTQNEGWKYDNFADFLELIGLKTPVTLKNLNPKTNSFECVSANDSLTEIKLRFGDGFDYCSEIHLIKGNQELCYSVNTNMDDGTTLPRVTLEYRIITTLTKKLSCFYSKYFCNRNLTLSNNYVLKVEISEPEKSNDTGEILVLRNSDEIETCLLNLENPVNVKRLYNIIIQLLGFTEEDINNCNKFSISYYKVTNTYDLLDKILITNGQKS